MKKTLLFTLLTPAIAIAPIASIVSCSDSEENKYSPESGINPSTNSDFYEGDKIFDINNPSRVENNKLFKEIQNAQTKGTKSEKEIVSIAQNKLDTMSSEEFKKYLTFSMIKGAYKIVETSPIKDYSNELIELYDVENVSYNKDTKLASFTLIQNITQNSLKNNNMISSVFASVKYHIEDLKLVASYKSDDKENGKTDYYATISVDSQNNNTTAKVESVNYVFNNNINELWEFYKLLEGQNANPNETLMTEEEFKTTIAEQEELLKKSLETFKTFTKPNKDILNLEGDSAFRPFPVFKMSIDSDSFFRFIDDIYIIDINGKKLDVEKYECAFNLPNTPNNN